MQRTSQTQNVGLGVIGLAIIGSIIWLVFSEIARAPWQFLTILIALFGTLITVVGNLNNQIRSEQIPKKVEVYEEIIKLYFDVIFAEKLNQEKPTSDEIIKGIIKVSPDLIMWGSDEVIKRYVALRSNTSDEPQDKLIQFSQLLRAMRKDLGHNNQGIDEAMILRIFINEL